MKLFIYEFICAGGLGAETPRSLREEGWAMLAALVEDFDAVDGVETLTLIDKTCPKPLGRYCRRLGPGEERVGFHEVLAQADMALVIAPEFDDFLAERTHWVLEAGIPLLGSALPAINLSGDKYALAQHLTRHGIPTPATILLPHDSLIGGLECPFPAVCKPRHGAGSQATYLVRGPKDLGQLLARARAELPDDDFLLQPFIRGQPASITFLIGPKQRLALPPVTQHLSADGRFHYLGGSLPLPEPLAQRALYLGEKTLDTMEGPAGMVGVDFILGEAQDGSQDWIIEINPRPTTSYIGLRQLARNNLADALVRITRGEEIAPIRWRQGVVRFSTRL